MILTARMEVFTVGIVRIIGIIELGNTGAVVEHAAGRRRALAWQQAARRMRKRRDVPAFACARLLYAPMPPN
jgi:hypothetical protein